MPVGDIFKCTVVSFSLNLSNKIHVNINVTRLYLYFVFVFLNDFNDLVNGHDIHANDLSHPGLPLTVYWCPAQDREPGSSAS